jgi:hypothetical protein
LCYDRYEGEDQQQQLVVVADPGEVRPPLTLCHRVEIKPWKDFEGSTAFLFLGITKKAVMKTRPFYFRK